MVLLGFLGQIFIQGFALPDEAPRATIERLTGIDINPSGMMDDMPGMHMAMPGHMHHPQGTHDHDDGSCPLCPLLQIVAILLTTLPLFPGRSFRWTALRAQPIQPRAPRLQSVHFHPPANHQSCSEPHGQTSPPVSCTRQCIPLRLHPRTRTESL